MVKYSSSVILFFFIFIPVWLFAQANSSSISQIDKILTSFDGSSGSPQQTFAKFILSLKQSDLLMYISCMSSERKKEMIQTDENARNFDRKRLSDAITGFKTSSPESFSIENFSIQTSPPKITFISSSTRGNLYSKAETVLLFTKEKEEWLISDVKTKAIEKRAVK